MRAGALFLAVLVLLLMMNSTYVVRENEQAIITQFGKPIGEAIVEPGLKVKLPFFHKVHRFDRRFLEWDGNTSQLNTKEKQPIDVDTYARWRIEDPLLYFQRVRDELGAQSRLDDILNGETRNVIANYDLVELVRSTNRTPALDPSQVEGEEPQITWKTIENGRKDVRRDILERSQARTKDLGIEVLDLQFKRINYVESVRREMYERMIAERRRIAARFRSLGQGEAARIRGRTELDLQRIQSDAFRLAEEIRGDADAEATDLYAQAYNQSADSRSFYTFLKSMETLQSTVDANTAILLSTDGEFYRFLESSEGR